MYFYRLCPYGRKVNGTLTTKILTVAISASSKLQISALLEATLLRRFSKL